MNATGEFPVIMDGALRTPSTGSFQGRTETRQLRGYSSVRSALRNIYAPACIGRSTVSISRAKRSMVLTPIWRLILTLASISSNKNSLNYEATYGHGTMGNEAHQALGCLDIRAHRDGGVVDGAEAVRL